MHIPSDLWEHAPYVAFAAYVVSLVKNAIDQDSRTTNLIKILVVLAAITVVLAIAAWLLSGGLARLPAGASWGAPSGAWHRAAFRGGAAPVSSVDCQCRTRRHRQPCSSAAYNTPYAHAT